MNKIIPIFYALFIGLTLSIGLIAQAQGTVNTTIAPPTPTTPSQPSSGTIESSTGSTQGPSGGVITKKCGVNTFSVENECGVGAYKNMYFECYDGYAEKQGEESSCKSSETWQEYAKEICAKRCVTNTQVVPPTEPSISSPTSAGWKTYQNKNYTFSFKAPTNCLTQDFDSSYAAKISPLGVQFDCIHSATEIEKIGRAVSFEIFEEKTTFTTKDDAIKIAEEYCVAERTGASTYCDKAVKQTEFINNNVVKGYEIYLNLVNQSCNSFEANENPNIPLKCNKTESTIGPVFLLDISANGVKKSLFVRGDREIISKLVQTVAISSAPTEPWHPVPKKGGTVTGGNTGESRPSISGRTMLINPPVPTAISICAESIMKQYNDLLQEMKNSSSQTEESKKAIHDKLTALKQEIYKKCTITPTTATAPDAKGIIIHPDRCLALDQWQQKIAYYEKLAGLDQEALKKEADFSVGEIQKILSELHAKYNDLQEKCKTKTGSRQMESSASSGSSTTAEPVNPVSATSGHEIDNYYKAKVEKIINSKDTTSQLQQLQTLQTEIKDLVGNFIKSRKEVESTELGSLVKKIDIQPGEIKADDVTVSTNDKKIFIGLGNKPVSVEPTAGEVTMQDQNIHVGVSGGVSIKDNVLTVGNISVNFAPSSIAEKNNIIPKEVTLQENNGKAVYEMKTNEIRKLFGLISVNLAKTVTADAGNGEILTEKLPWYSFITTKLK